MSQPSIKAPLGARVLPLWPEQEIAAGTTPDLAPDLLRQPELLPRFGAYYTQLRALPRRVRRALQRQWKQSLAGAALLLALGQAPALAATINVTGGCTLVAAIRAANTNMAQGGCPRGNGADTIVLPSSSTQTLITVNNSIFGPTGLPVISSALTIEGRNSTIRRNRGDPDLFRIFAINDTGNLTLKDTTISGGIASGDGCDFVLMSFFTQHNASPSTRNCPSAARAGWPGVADSVRPSPVSSASHCGRSAP
jgi:hypothetical protein